MAAFRVFVEKEYVVRGHIEVQAGSRHEALQVIEKQMDERRLQTVDARIQWGEPEYIDFSFQTTGEAG